MIHRGIPRRDLAALEGADQRAAVEVELSTHDEANGPIDIRPLDDEAHRAMLERP